MRKLLLFGGTFDPPHKGHMQLLKSAIDAVLPDRVVVMPSGTAPHKAASTTAGEIRLAMCRCFLPLHKNLVISDWEIEKGGKSYTIHTVDMLQKKYPEAAIYLCVGSDMLASFTTWKNWQQLLAACVLVVHSRQNGDGQQLHKTADELRCLGGRILFTHGRVVPVSSTALRKGFESETLLPAAALAEIKTHGLYAAQRQAGLDWAEELARTSLSQPRYAHTLNVRDAALTLADRYGESPFKAALAALLHDIAKEMPREKMLQTAMDNDIITDNAAALPAVLHGPCAAVWLKAKWGIADEEILDAIRYHTTGRPGMTRLDKIIYLSDMICAERDYPEVYALRHLAGIDLDTAVYTAVKMNIEWMEQCGKSIDPISKQALADLSKGVACP